MDRLDTGALAVDANGLVRAVNNPARAYLGLSGDPRGRPLHEVLGSDILERVAGAAIRLRSEEEVSYEEIELPVGDGVRLRITLHPLTAGDADRELGYVILAREISHEPIRRRFEEIIEGLASSENAPIREQLLEAQKMLAEVSAQVSAAAVSSPGMGELRDRTSRTLTAIEYWIAVDDTLAREEFPEAQPMLDRMRLANARWPLQDRLPNRVRELSNRVEAYYESGENPKQPVL
jgi:hypothetical protein